jgi:AcrR family transcriptional regulator
VPEPVQQDASPRAAQIVAAARTLLEAEGAGSLSMRRIAERLGIKAPSLYKHLPDKQAVENAVISQGFVEMAEAFEAIVDEPGTDAVLALGRAYREVGQEHPHLYRLMTERELDRDALAPGVEDAAASALVRAVGGDADLARAVWAFMHGMTVLELNARFPPDADLDAAWDRGLRALSAVREEAR